MKTIHKVFCLGTLEKLMKDFPGGSYLVMRSTQRFTGKRTHLAIGYKYNYKRFQRFSANEGGGSTEPGYPYISRFPDVFLIFLVALLFVLTC